MNAPQTFERVCSYQWDEAESLYRWWEGPIEVAKKLSVEELWSFMDQARKNGYRIENKDD